ncbi:MAG: penicillin-binding protein [Solobacterium sp.]|nr:penicillin-binding protein [Solobacterium sp.]
MKNRSNRSVLLIFTAALVVMAMLAADVFLVTIAKVHLRSGTDLSAYADSANTVREITKAMRGNIYTSDGSVIAEDSRTYNIVCILDENRPSLENEITYVKDKEYTAEQLSRILRMDYDTCLNYLSQDIYQTELGTAGRNISESTKKEIEELELPGIEFTDSIRRLYPMGQFASNLIGFAQSDETGSTVGKMGTELYLNDYLAGSDGYRIYQADKNGFILPGMKEERVSAVNGYNVRTTIDEDIQSAMEESFGMTVDLFNPSRIWSAVMDIDTGKILGWGQYPSFDANTLDIVDYNNYGTQIPYEPGSTMKTFTYAAAINEGVYDGSAEVYGGPFRWSWDENRNPVRDNESFYVIYNANMKDYGMSDYDHGLIYSANTITAAVETELITPDIYLDYLKKFGFFQPVSTDGLPEETGYLNFTWPYDKLALCYGQGSSVTMLQMLQAYSAVFGDGTMKKPYYIESITDPYDSNRTVYQAETRTVGEPITEETAKELQRILYRVVNDDDGTAKYYRIPECEIMGKTGTTQVAYNGTYATGYTIVSLMSALPADDPKVIVYYAFEAPYNHDAHYYSQPVQNLLRKTAMAVGAVKNEEPVTEETEPEETEEVLTAGDMPVLINHTVSYSSDKLRGLNARVIVLGSGNTVIDQYPRAGSLIDNNERIFLLTDTNSFIMPDMTGWTRKDVVALWSVTQFGFRLKGDGRVISQNVTPGTTVTKGTEIEVELE